MAVVGLNVFARVGLDVFFARVGLDVFFAGVGLGVFGLLVGDCVGFFILLE